MGKNKPTGNVGPIGIINSKSGVIFGWEKIDFPKLKEQIEDYFCERFIYSIKKNGATCLRVEKNEQNDFDYTLTLPGGRVSLELTEYTRPVEKGSPYIDKENKILNVYTEAENILKTIKNKCHHYNNVNGVVHLLVYVTHWSFSVADISIAIVKHWLMKEPPIFENVFFYEPLDENEGNLRVLYPSTAEYVLLNPEEYKENTCILFSPAKMMFSFNGEN